MAFFSNWLGFPKKPPLPPPPLAVTLQDESEVILAELCAPPPHNPNGPPNQNRTIPNYRFPQIQEELVKLENGGHGAYGWNHRPRIYTVLRNIRRLDLMDFFVRDGHTDFELPFDDHSLPSFVKDSSTRRMFLEFQPYVLTPAKSMELPEGNHLSLFSGTASTFLWVRKDLGQGGYGAVDHVMSKLSLRDYARKRVLRGKDTARNLIKERALISEFSMLKRLSHHHLVKYVGSYTDTEHIAYLMEPVADCNLFAYLIEVEKSPHLRTTLRYFYGCLAGALDFLHGKDIRHRDLKPGNILIKDGRVFIADFGTAYDFTNSKRSTTADDNVPHTRDYMPPEASKPGRRKNCSSDLWSLGVVFLEMSTVLLGSTLKEFKYHMKIAGLKAGREPHVWSNLSAAGDWMAKLIKKDAGLGQDNETITWVRGLLKDDPVRRHSSHGLMRVIFESPSFNSFCCMSCWPEYRNKSFKAKESQQRSGPNTAAVKAQQVTDHISALFNHNPALEPVELEASKRNELEDWISSVSATAGHPIPPQAHATTSDKLSYGRPASVGNSSASFDSDDDSLYSLGGSMAAAALQGEQDNPKTVVIDDLAGPSAAQTPDEPNVEDELADPTIGKRLRGPVDQQFETETGIIDGPTHKSTNQTPITHSYPEGQQTTALVTLPMGHYDLLEFMQQQEKDAWASCDNSTEPPPVTSPWVKAVNESDPWRQDYNDGKSAVLYEPMPGAWDPDDVFEVVSRSLSPLSPLPASIQPDDVIDCENLPEKSLQLETDAHPQLEPVPEQTEPLEDEINPNKGTQPMPNVFQFLVNGQEPHVQGLGSSASIRSERSKSGKSNTSIRGEPAPKIDTKPESNEKDPSAVVVASPVEGKVRPRGLSRRNTEVSVSSLGSLPDNPQVLSVSSEPDRPTNVNSSTKLDSKFPNESGQEVKAPSSTATESQQATDLPGMSQNHLVELRNLLAQFDRTHGDVLLSEQPAEANSDAGSLLVEDGRSVCNSPPNMDTDLEAWNEADSKDDTLVDPTLESTEHDPVQIAVKSEERHVSFVTEERPISQETAVHERTTVQTPTAPTNESTKKTSEPRKKANKPAGNSLALLKLAQKNAAKKRREGGPVSQNDAFSYFSPVVYMNDRWEAPKTEATMVGASKGKRSLAMFIAGSMYESRGDLGRFCKEGNVRTVRKLLAEGFKPDKPDFQPIFHAVRGCTVGHYKCVQELIKFGVNINAREGRTGKTPLQAAIENENFKYYTSLVKTLIDAEANPNKKDYDGIYTILSVFKADGEDLEPLQKFREDALACLLASSAKKINLDVKETATGNTALHLAVQRKSFWAVGLLLNKGANVNEVNSAGVTPLLQAAAQWSGRLTEDQQTLLELLLMCPDIDLNKAGGHNQRTALLQAAANASPSAVRMLVERGADLTLCDSAGDNARTLAYNLARSQWRDERAEILEILPKD